MKTYQNPKIELLGFALESAISVSQGSDEHIYNPGDETGGGTELV